MTQKSTMGNVMDSEIIFMIEDSRDGGFEARALGHPIFTEADSMETLKEEIRDAVSCHFDENEKPALIRLHFVKDEVIPA
jgi:hypothetical protein